MICELCVLVFVNPPTFEIELHFPLVKTEFSEQYFIHQLLLFMATTVCSDFSLIFALYKANSASSVASQNRPVGQCESFMARRMESVRVNLFCPGRGRTLTQSLALQQERSARLETAPKHEQNHTVARHSYRKTCECVSYFVCIS